MGQAVRVEMTIIIEIAPNIGPNMSKPEYVSVRRRVVLTRNMAFASASGIESDQVGWYGMAWDEMGMGIGIGRVQSATVARCDLYGIL